MIPTHYWQLARAIHEERIAAARARRPDWMYEAELARKSARPSYSKRLRTSIAQALRWLAANIEPSSSAWVPDSSSQPALPQ